MIALRDKDNVLCHPRTNCLGGRSRIEVAHQSAHLIEINRQLKPFPRVSSGERKAERVGEAQEGDDGNDVVIVVAHSALRDGTDWSLAREAGPGEASKVSHFNLLSFPLISLAAWMIGDGLRDERVMDKHQPLSRSPYFWASVLKGWETRRRGNLHGAARKKKKENLKQMRKGGTREARRRRLSQAASVNFAL